MIKKVIEKSLLESNNIDKLTELPPNFTLNLSAHKDLLTNFTKDLNLYVKIGNDYLYYKNIEECAKVSLKSK